MEIICIFTNQLYTFHYEDEPDNEYHRLMELWTDVHYLYQFAKNNAISDIEDFINEVLYDVEQIQDFIESLIQNQESLVRYFEPLGQIEQRKKRLALQKGKIERSCLRIYAIKVDEDCFIITGGAIKITQRMQDHVDTQQELTKLNNARSYLELNGVFDDNSFYELIWEQRQ